MRDVVIGIASNIEPDKNTSVALEALQSRYETIAVAPFERTQAIGRPEQGDYLNGAMRMRVEGSMEQLKRTLGALELSLGRVRTDDKYAARTIDLDILVVDGDVVDPDVATRPFLQRAIQAVMPEMTFGTDD